jgi:hypothetical protein
VNTHTSTRRWPGVAFSIGLALAPSVARGLTPAQDTVRRLQQGVDLLSTVVGRAFGGALPVPTASVGVQYEFDPATASFVRAPAVSGQVYVQRGETLGRQRLNLSLTWERVVLDQLGGQEARHLPPGRPTRLDPTLAAAFRLGPTRAAAITNRLLPTLTWGPTETIDLSLTMPVVHSDISIRSRSLVAAITIQGAVVSRSELFQDAVNEWGPGDLQLRARYRLPTGDALPAAAGIGLRLPTGDIDLLRGAGTTYVTPELAVSTPRWTPARWATLQGHANAGVDLDARDVGASVPRWAVGLDWGLRESLTMSVAVLGRHPLRRLAPAGALDTLRCPTFARCLRSPQNIGLRPLYDIDPSRPDYFDFSIGGRVALWRDTIIGFANVVVPLNDAGVRFEPIPLVGFEATF